MQRRKFLTAMGGAVTTAAFAGCGGGGGGSQNEGPTYGQQTTEYSGDVAATVEYSDGGFEPRKVGPIPVDGTVEFVNGTDSTHNLASDKVGELPSWNLSQSEWEAGQSVYFTFTEANIYAFRNKSRTRFNTCGAVVVGEDNAIEDIPNLPCEEDDLGFEFESGDSNNSSDGNTTSSNDENA